MMTRNRQNPSVSSPENPPNLPAFPLSKAPPGFAKLSIAAILLAASLFPGCKRSAQPPASESPTATIESEKQEPPSSSAASPSSPKTAPSNPPVSSSKPSANSAPPAPYEIWKEFSGDKAFAEARNQVEIGPRPSGSPEIETARALIEKSLHGSGWDTERQTFTNETPHGHVEFVNIIARFSASGKHPAPDNTQRAIVCSHYDTKIFHTIKFVGASDGASSTGALLELARVLALDPVLASKIELVFFDGEEAVVQFTSPDDPHPDGLYGSRYYALKLRNNSRAAQFQFGILWDMIGARDLNITLPPNSPPALTRDIMEAADALKLRNHFSVFDRPILDDHVPLIEIDHISTIDLIDFDYPVWHTADDDLEHIGPESLQQVGAVTLYRLRKAFGR
jgi:glutaminyl-peptide cyclotransferase